MAIRAFWRVQRSDANILGARTLFALIQPKSSGCGYRSWISGVRVMRGLRISDFLRNEPPNPAEYLGERPEMSSQ